MIDVFSVNRTPVRPVNDNSFESESSVGESSAFSDADNDNSHVEDTFEDAVAQQAFIADRTLPNTVHLPANALHIQQDNVINANNEQLATDKFTSQTMVLGSDPMQSILQQTQMLSLANEGSLTREMQAQLINSNLANSTTTSVSQGSTIDVQLQSVASRLQQSTPNPLNDLHAPASFNGPAANKMVNALASSLNQSTTVSMAFVNELLSNQNNELANIKVMFQATQSGSTFNNQQSTPLFAEHFKPASTPIKELQNNRLTYSQFSNSQQVVSTHLSTDFSFIDDTKTEFNLPTRFSPFNTTEQANVANWQIHPAMTEVKDIPMMQLTSSALDKTSAENTSQRAMVYGSNSIEQQRTQQLQQLVNTGNFTEVTVKDSKLGDIHFSVSGKQKEHLGVLVTHSQTLNVVQTHLVEIQQELAEEGVTDFEMFSSKEEQEQQKREYLAQQSKSFAETQQELEEQDLPNVKATIIGKYHHSSINITA